jgi:hypothetical protein
LLEQESREKSAIFKGMSEKPTAQLGNKLIRLVKTKMAVVWNYDVLSIANEVEME